MSDDAMRGAVAGLTIFYIAWIAGYALYSSVRNKVRAVAVSPRRASPWQRVLLLTAIMLDAYLIARAWHVELDQWVWAQRSPAPLAALGVMLAGGVLMMATQLNMGASWRIGVPKKSGDIDALVTTGAHRFSRNPIYLGILLIIAGAALAAPGPLTIAALVVTFVGMRSIIAEEEAYLEHRFGAVYLDYKKRVRRWI